MLWGKCREKERDGLSGKGKFIRGKWEGDWPLRRTSVLPFWWGLSYTLPMKNSLTAAAAKSLQLCPTLCDPIDGSPPGSPVPGILQARTLEWLAISFSNSWKWKVKVKSLSRVRLLATPWTAAHQAPPSMGFARQEYWSGLHCLLQDCREKYQ